MKNYRGGLIRGTAKIYSPESKSWTNIKVNKPIDLKVNDIIKTGPNTRLLVRYKDGSVFRLKSNTVLTILPEGVQLKYGGAWFNLHKEGKAFRVRTYTTVAGDLGTIFNVSYDRASEKTTIELMDGIVEAKTKNNAFILLKPGERATISATENRKVNFDYKSQLSEEKAELKKELAALNFKSAPANKTDKAANENNNVKGKKAGDSPVVWGLIAFFALLAVIGAVVLFRKRK